MATVAKFEGIIQPWGNSLGLRITKAVGELSHLKKGTKVILEVRGEELVVRPKQRGKHMLLPFTEEELIAGLTPELAHADELPKVLSTELGD